MADLDLEVLPDLPKLGPAFVRALLPAARGTSTVPAQTVMVPDHSQDASRFAGYSRVCGFTLRDAVPPTWLHVLTFPLQVHLLSGSDSAARLAGMVHVSNTMTLHRPVTLAEKLNLFVHATALRPHRRGALVDLVGQVRVGDEVVWDGVSTYLTTRLQLPGAPAETERAAFTPASPSASWRLSADLGRRYRAVSGDVNPIHTSRLAARAFGFARPIIHGMWTHARALAALENKLPASYRAEAQFTRPILLPATVGFAAAGRTDGWDAAVTTRDGAKPFLLLTTSP